MRASGTLSIYRQFIAQLPFWGGNNKYYIFVDPSMDQPKIDGVKYVLDSNHSKIHYIWWSFWGLKLWLKKNRLSDSVIVSLQNIGTLTRKKQIIYYHNALPFYPRKWSFLKSSERSLAVYKYIYPLIVKCTINQNTRIVVQIPFIKKEIIKHFKVSPSNVYVLFPDVNKIEATVIQPYPFEEKLYHFLYPATDFPFKEHRTLVQSMMVLREMNPSLAQKIRIHLTLYRENCSTLFHFIEENDLTEQFVFEGTIPYEKLLTYYKAATGLLYPSTIETVGLPLIESASFGLPIIASDLQYAHEVLGNYEGVRFVGTNEFGEWAREIERVCIEKKLYQPMIFPESTWKDFFSLICDSSNL